MRPTLGGELGGAVRTKVGLMLSGRCNLACSYCYQDKRRVRASMRWETARAALDGLLRLGANEISVEFSGGEPLLEPDLMRRAVRYIEGRRGRREVSFLLITNGTLLTREVLDFLVEHAFRLRLSFDGVSAAQDLRAPGTFAVLDRLLDLLRRSYPTYFRKNVYVGMTLCASAIPQFAQSVRYFLAKGVSEIELGLRLTPEPDWDDAKKDKLQAQVDEILEISLDHWRRSGRVPLKFLAPAPLRNADAPVGEFLCTSVHGDSFVVDPDGRGWACPLLVPSLCTIPLLAADASRVLALGNVSNPALLGRLRRLPSKARSLRMYTHKREKHSSYGRCADCRFVADCYVCPNSICHIPGNEDPDRVPDFMCAYNQVTLEARERFDEMTGGELSAAWYREVRAILGRLEAAIRKSMTGLGCEEPARRARSDRQQQRRAR